jgi:ribose transport system substrate-binding protein
MSATAGRGASREEEGMRNVSGTRRCSARRVLAAGVAGALLAGVVAACGSGSSQQSQTSAGGSSVAREAKAEQARFFKGVGYHSPPTTSPPPQRGKRVWIISCDQSIASCSTPIAAALEAAKAMGWKTTLYDAKLNPARIAEGYRQAIAAKADGIVSYSIDCPLAPGALAQAEKAGIKVVTGESLDCKKPLFDYVVNYTEGSFPKWFAATGSMAATNLIAGRNGAPKVIVVDQTDVPLLVPSLEGFKKRMAQCGESCEIVDTVQFTTPDLGASLQQKIQQAILQHPEANAMFLEYDNYSLGAGPALRASGRMSKFLVSIAEGQASTLDDMRSGQLNGVGTGLPQGWESYQAVDALNRIFAGQKPAPSGIGLQAFDKTHNMPAKGRWEPPIDYKSAYQKAWGVSQ